MEMAGETLVDVLRARATQ